MSIFDDIVNFFTGGGQSNQTPAPKMPDKLQAANDARNRRSNSDRQERQAGQSGHQAIQSSSRMGQATGTDFRVPTSQQQRPWREAYNQQNIQRNLGGAKPQASPYTQEQFRANDPIEAFQTRDTDDEKKESVGGVSPSASKISAEKLAAANEAKNRRAKQDTKETFDFSESLANFMNSDNPYAQAYLSANGIDPGSFNWSNDYGKFASEGGKDAWAAMITSSPKMKQAYMDDYGSQIDFDGDSDISLQEAGQWYQNMKDENQVERFDFRNIDDEIMQRVFGGLQGNGMDNNIVDALNMTQTNAILTNLAAGMSIDDAIKSGAVLTPIASDTGDTFASTIGLIEDLSKEDLDETSPEYTDKIARLNNAMKLDMLISAADRNRESGEKRNVIDFGDNTAKYAAELSSLMNNVAGGDAGIMLSDTGRPVGSDNKIYDVPISGNPEADVLSVANSVINSGGKDMSDDLAYLLINYLGAGDGQSLSDQGYKGSRSSGGYDDPQARRTAQSIARAARRQQANNDASNTSTYDASDVIDTLGSQAKMQLGGYSNLDDSSESRQALMSALNGMNYPSTQEAIDQISDRFESRLGDKIDSSNIDEARRIANAVGEPLAKWKMLTGR